MCLGLVSRGADIPTQGPQLLKPVVLSAWSNCLQGTVLFVCPRPAEMGFGLLSGGIGTLWQYLPPGDGRTAVGVGSPPVRALFLL